MSHHIPLVRGRAGGEPREGRLSRKGGAMGTRTSIWAGTAAFVTALGSLLVAGPDDGGGVEPRRSGVTAKTIAVGLPYVNFEALKSLGVTIDDGSFPDAYNGVIKMINAHGGVNGRKLVLSMAEMNPSVPAEATSSCTQLTEDDQVFIAIAPVFPDCYQVTHNTPVIIGSLPGTIAGFGGARLRPHPAGRELRPAAAGRLQEGRRLQGQEGRHLLRCRLRRPRSEGRAGLAQEVGCARGPDRRGQRAGDRRRCVRPGKSSPSPSASRAPG